MAGGEEDLLCSGAVMEHEDSILVRIQLGTKMQVPLLQQLSCLWCSHHGTSLYYVTECCTTCHNDNFLIKEASFLPLCLTQDCAGKCALLRFDLLHPNLVVEMGTCTQKVQSTSTVMGYLWKM